MFADKRYAGRPNRNFLAENKTADGIMRKNSTTATLTQLNMFQEYLLRNFTGQAEYEIERNKKIFAPCNSKIISLGSKVRYIACPVEFPSGRVAYSTG